MFKLNDMIPVIPESSAGASTIPPGKGTVVYIHPLGRFYVVRFDFACGSYCEARWFTANELEEGAKKGLFKVVRRRTDSFKPKGFVMSALAEGGFFPQPQESDEFDPAMI